MIICGMKLRTTPIILPIRKTEKLICQSGHSVVMLGVEMNRKSLPLYPGAKPCVRSGYCCKKAPCAFGTWDENLKQCKHLQKDVEGQYECAIYEEITGKEFWELNPAFGAGCCSPLNSDRQRIIQEAANRSAKSLPRIAESHL